MLEGLFPKTKMQILTLLFSRPDEWFYNRQIKEVVGVGQGAVQRELTKLSRTGIIERVKRGNQVYYRANKTNPVYPELNMLITKTTGLANYLREALKLFSGKIEFAYIYGSFADGTADAESDVDLMVVGDIDSISIAGALSDMSEELSREVNPSVYDVEEYNSELEVRDSFIAQVHSDPKIMLIGEIDEPL